jgi:tetratricopeptide (TPR) repeat protein
MSRLATALLLAVCLFAAPAPEFERGRALYQRTEYQSSLNLLLPLENHLGNDGAAALQLIGQDYFMLGEYKKSADAFDRALALGNPSQQLYTWAGRAYGRRAESSGPFTAPGLASRARKYFETAVQMDILNKESSGDLFDYYMGAPGFLGGGANKAQDLARRVAAADPAEGQHLLAVLSERNKDYDTAEQHLRQAIQLAPKQASRVMELARFLAKRGRARECDALFDQAVRMAPENHAMLFYRAQIYIEGNRNLSDARSLLESYLSAPLTPDDPPRERAQELLAKTPH